MGSISDRCSVMRTGWPTSSLWPPRSRSRRAAGRHAAATATANDRGRHRRCGAGERC